MHQNGAGNSAVFVSAADAGARHCRGTDGARFMRAESWISADEAVANRFRNYLKEHAGSDDGPPQTLVVKAWLNPDGTVERVSFQPLNDTQADADLHTILKRGNVGEAPPPEMVQPLNLECPTSILRRTCPDPCGAAIWRARPRPPRC